MSFISMLIGPPPESPEKFDRWEPCGTCGDLINMECHEMPGIYDKDSSEYFCSTGCFKARDLIGVQTGERQ